MQTHSESIGKLAAAITKLQGSLGSVSKDSTAKIDSKTGRSFSYTYADLGAVWAAIREPLASNGLAVIQAPMTSDAGDVLVTTLVHSSGEWARSCTRLPVADKNDPKALGSSITYMRRYALMSLLGIVTDDDDGTAAAGQGGSYGRKGQPAKKVQAPPEPEPEAAPTPAGLSPEKASGLHAKLAGFGVPQLLHAEFASAVVGREVSSFKELTTRDATRIYEAGQELHAGLIEYRDGVIVSAEPA